MNDSITVKDFHTIIIKPAIRRLTDAMNKYVTSGFIEPSENRKEMREKQYRELDEIVIDHCYHNCKYFKLDGGPGPIMFCAHPETQKNYPGPYEDCIISHPDCTTGFPEKCPLPICKENK